MEVLCSTLGSERCWAFWAAVVISTIAWGLYNKGQFGVKQMKECKHPASYTGGGWNGTLNFFTCSNSCWGTLEVTAYALVTCNFPSLLWLHWRQKKHYCKVMQTWGCHETAPDMILVFLEDKAFIFLVLSNPAPFCFPSLDIMQFSFFWAWV